MTTENSHIQLSINSYIFRKHKHCSHINPQNKTLSVNFIIVTYWSREEYYSKMRRELKACHVYITWWLHMYGCNEGKLKQNKRQKKTYHNIATTNKQ